MPNPTMSLLQTPLRTDALGTAKKALSIAPKSIRTPSVTKASTPSFVSDFESTLADDIVIQNVIDGRYQTNTTPGQVRDTIVPQKQYANGVDAYTDNEQILNYISGYETPGAVDPYKAVNNKSGAFGKYQFIPRYAKPYADKLGISMEELRSTPGYQDEAAALKLQDLYRELKAKNIPITKPNIYLGWQQGAGGLSQLLQGTVPSNMALDQNLPPNVPRTAKGFLDYWYSKL